MALQKEIFFSLSRLIKKATKSRWNKIENNKDLVENKRVAILSYRVIDIAIRKLCK